MKRKAFADRLLKVLGVKTDEYVISLSLYSDKHTDGTKVLRIKMGNNPTGKSLRECTNILNNYLTGVAGIKHVVVRGPVGDSWAGLKFIIQVEYVGTLPDLDSPQPMEEESPKKEESSPYKITEMPGGTFKVETPFGVGHASDKEDLNKLMLWLEGMKVGMGFGNSTKEETQPEPVRTEEDYKEDLENIVAEDPSDWWSQAYGILDDYCPEDREHYRDIANEVFQEWMYS